MGSEKIGPISAIFTVLASMIGTGIFGVTGLLQAQIQNPVIILACWIFGSAVAIAGALCYSEIAAYDPSVGGEYGYLKRIYGPLPAFLTGWTSVFVAFAAPVAATSFILVEYISTSLGLFGLNVWADVLLRYKLVVACLVILGFSLIHSLGARKGIFFQNFVTVLKLVVFAALSIFGLYHASQNSFSSLVDHLSYDQKPVSMGPIGTAMLMISFSFSGWNAAIYLGSEIKQASKNIPRALLWGTAIASVLYIAIFFIIYSNLTIDQIQGQSALLSIVVHELFGGIQWIDAVLNLALSLIILSSLSVNLLLGSRVAYAMSKEIKVLHPLSKVSPSSAVPVRSILVQAVISMLYLVTGTFSSIVVYLGFSLSVFPILTVAGNFIMRRHIRSVDLPYHTPLYPLLPSFFILSSLFIMGTNLVQNTFECLMSLCLLLLGAFLFTYFESKNSLKDLKPNSLFVKGSRY